MYIAAVLALAAAAAARGRAHPGLAVGATSTWALVLQVAAATLTAGVGALVLGIPRSRLSGALLLVAAPTVALAMVPGPEAGSAALFTAALVGSAAAPVMIGAAAAAYPVDGPRSRWLAPVALAGVLGVGINGLARASLFQPAANGCFACPHNLLDARAGAGSFAAIDRWTPWLTIVWSVVVVAVVVMRWLAANSSVRRRVSAVLVAGTVAVLAGAGAIDDVVALPEPFNRGAQALWLAQCALILMSGTLVLAEAAGTRGLSRRIAELALRDDIDPSAVTAAITRSLGRAAHIDIVFPRGEAASVDSDANVAIDSPAGYDLVALRRSGATTAEVRYPSSATGTSYRLVAAVRAAGLVVERIGASARLHAELADLAASRRRIIEASDSERRRLERDLHDGAQQRLIALSLLLRSAARRDHNPVLDQAANEVANALAELRQLARGIYPVTLSDMNLAVALRSLAETTTVPLSITTELAGPPTPAVARTVYQLIAQVTQAVGRHPCTAESSVIATVSQIDRDVRVCLTTALQPSLAGVLGGSADRVEALSGTLTCTSHGDRQVVEMMVPCGS